MLVNQDKGYVLVTTLLLLLVLTIIGIAAIETSTFETMLSGNSRLRESNLANADAGTIISTSIIERTVREQDTEGFTDIIYPDYLTTDSGYLPTELRSSAFDTDNEDVTYTLTTNGATMTVSADIDKMYSNYMEGTAVEFGSGFEGVGKGSGSGFIAYYRINTSGTGVLNSEARIGAIYKYVPK